MRPVLGLPAQWKRVSRVEKPVLSKVHRCLLVCTATYVARTCLPEKSETGLMPVWLGIPEKCRMGKLFTSGRSARRVICNLSGCQKIPAFSSIFPSSLLRSSCRDIEHHLRHRSNNLLTWRRCESMQMQGNWPFFSAKT